MLPRRQFVAYCSALGLSGTLFPGALYARVEADGEVTVEAIAAAEKLAGLAFTPEEREMMVEDLEENLEGYRGAARGGPAQPGGAVARLRSADRRHTPARGRGGDGVGAA